MQSFYNHEDYARRFFLSSLLYFSGPVGGERNGNYDANSNSDSTLITIPFPVKFGSVSKRTFWKRNQNRFILQQVHQFAFLQRQLLVAKNGRILYEDYKGLSNIKTGKKVDANTAIHLASVSKILTATAILKLVQEDNIMLDQKVTDWLPRFPIKTPPSELY